MLSYWFQESRSPMSWPEKRPPEGQGGNYFGPKSWKRFGRAKLQAKAGVYQVYLIREKTKDSKEGYLGFADGWG